MAERVFFNKFITKGLTAKDSNERFFEGILTVQMVDKQNEITVVDELMKVLPVWMDRGAPISDTHSNRIIGKGINYAKTFVEDSDGSKYPAITITGKIFKDYKLDDQIWEYIKTGRYRGLSFGGATKSDRTPVVQKDGSIAYSLKDLEHYEVAVCSEPAVPLAIITDYNPIAKAMMGDKLERREDGKCIIKCDRFGCYIDKIGIAENATGNASSSGVKDHDADESIKDPTPMIPENGQLVKGNVIDPAENLTTINKPIRGHDWAYWDKKLEGQGYDKETRGAIIGSWEKEKSEFAISEGIYNLLLKEIGSTMSAVGEQPGKTDTYVDPTVVDDKKEEKKKDLSQLQGGVRTGTGYDTAHQGPDPGNDSAQINVIEDDEDKKKNYIKAQTFIKGNGMTEQETKPIEKTEAKVETSVDKSILDAIASIADTVKKTSEKVDSFSTELKTIGEKVKAMEKPTDFPVKPAADDKEDIGAKVKVPDTYQSNSQQASIRDSDPKNEQVSDPSGLSMQVKSDSGSKTETPRPNAAVETVNKSSGITEDYSQILRDARNVGFEGLSAVAKDILAGKYYKPTESEVSLW